MDYNLKQWRNATIESQCSPVTYKVRTDDNRTWKRHVDQIKERYDKVCVPVMCDENASDTQSDKSNELGGVKKLNDNVKLSDVSNIEVSNIKSNVCESIINKHTSELDSGSQRRSVRVRKPLQKT